MGSRDISRYSFINAFGTAIYVILIASFMYIGGEGAFGSEENIFVPIFMLLLFVFSVALTGSLVFGRPVMWYLDGNKREALLLLVYTLLILFILTIIMFSLFVVLSSGLSR